MEIVKIREKVQEILDEVSKLCGIADNVSYMDCDNDSAECIDRVESKIKLSCNDIMKLLEES